MLKLQDQTIRKTAKVALTALTVIIFTFVRGANWVVNIMLFAPIASIAWWGFRRWRDRWFRGLAITLTGWCVFVLVLTVVFTASSFHNH